MARRCEICEGTQATNQDARRAPNVRRIVLGDRIIALCEEHAAAFRMSSARTLEEMRAQFAEASGRRSLLGRRSPLDRRVFPARPEGRRRGDGRRASDRGD